MGIVESLDGPIARVREGGEEIGWRGRCEVHGDDRTARARTKHLMIWERALKIQFFKGQARRGRRGESGKQVKGLRARRGIRGECVRFAATNWWEREGENSIFSSKMSNKFFKQRSR